MSISHRTNHNISHIVFDINSGDNEYVTMNLSTIPNRQNIIKKSENFCLRTDDIEGARHTPKKLPIHDFYNTKDIEGSSSKPMVNINKKPTDIMSVDDIDGARPRIIQQLPHSKRSVNPVDPQYDWPKYKCPVEPPPKFIRDTMKNDDVEGASPMTYKTNKPPRDIMRTDDIDGAHPKPTTLYTHNIGNRTFDVKDINNDGIFHSKRVTDPLNPVYHMNGEDLKADDFGKHFDRPPLRNVPDLYSPSDIDGAHADSVYAWTKTFKVPSPNEDDDIKPAPLLMTPSMKAQTKELEAQAKMREKRGERIKSMENRNLQGPPGIGDPVQDLLRRQRESRYHHTFQ